MEKWWYELVVLLYTHSITDDFSNSVISSCTAKILLFQSLSLLKFGKMKHFVLIIALVCCYFFFYIIPKL